jgi:nucleotide-binding universal stress UspA family protein
MYSRMLIPVDGSATAENVLPYARLLARTLNIPVELLEVLNVAEPARLGNPQNPGHLEDRVALAEASSAEYLRGVAATFTGANVHCTVEKGRPEDVIIAKGAGDASMLIAMATHGRSGISRWLLGSIAEKVLRAAANPLLVVRAHEGAATNGEERLDSVIVPLDGSDIAESALPTAVAIARPLNLEIVLFRAYELPASAYYGRENYLPDYEGLTEEVRAGAQAYLEEKQKTIKAQGIENVSWELLEGSAPDEIIECGRHRPHSLIAICTHGRSGVQRWVLGSVTEKVVRHSAGPVLVVRAVG